MPVFVSASAILNPPASHPTGPDLPLTPLSENLSHLLERADGKPMPIRDILEVLRGRGFNLLLVFFCLPFALPVSIPGLSTPFGLAILVLGVRIALRREPWLPKRVMDFAIRHDLLERTVAFGVKVATKVEKIVRPRARVLAAAPALQSFNGVVVVVAALALMVPLPLPLANFFPAWSIMLLALGMMEEDGAAIVAGYVLCVVSWGYFAVLWLLGMTTVNQIFGL
jgi:hypothetical protein